MGPFLFFNAALAGFFSFAAIYHLILWWTSRREPLLAVLSAHCGIRAIFNGLLVAYATATTSAEAQAALHARIGIGIPLMLTWVWILSLISGVRARRFVWCGTILALILFPLHVFVVPLNANVISVEQSVLPWGETISNAKLGAQGWWFGPLYVVVISIEVFGLYCGYRLWVRDRITGTIILLTNGVFIMLHVMHFLRAYGILDVPVIGAIGHVCWACLIALLVACRNHQMEKRLRESESRFRLLFEGANEAIFWADVETGLLTHCNLAAETLLGRERSEIIGQPQSFLHPPEDFHRYQALFHSHVTSNSEVSVEAEVIRKDGRKLDVSIAPSVTTIGTKKVIQGIFHNITDRKRKDDELRSSRQRLELLSKQLITTLETERRHLARELHDEIGQILTAIKMNLRRTHREADARLLPHLETGLAMIDGAIDQVRNLTLRLRPPQLDELGLVAALHWLVKQQAELGEFESQLDVDIGEVRISTELETVCFRIAQEALTNAVRHANSKKLNLKLWTQERQLHLSIQDNGNGFDIIKTRKRAMEGLSVGLISMQERASLVGGHFEIESTPESGTKIHASFPIPIA